jgi:hypothetical protein
MAVNNIPYDTLIWDDNVFNNLIKDQGVTLAHWKAVICPLGLIDANETIGSHSAHVNCENGYIYKFAGYITAYFSSNSAIANLSEMGILDGSTVSVTFPKNYDNTSIQAYIQIFDRFFIVDLATLVPNTQLIEASPTGYDKANYRIIQLEEVIDSNNISYSPDNYEVLDGKIHWVGQQRPGFDPQVGKGVIYSVRYLYEPYFYVSRLMHEVRVLNKLDYITNKKSVVRAPYAALLNREYYQFKKRNNVGVLGVSPEDDRTSLGPRDSIWNPK